MQRLSNTMWFKWQFTTQKRTQTEEEIAEEKVSVTDQGLLISKSLPLRRICGHWHTVTYPKINCLSVLAFPPWGGTDWGHIHTQVLSISLSLLHTRLSWLHAHIGISLSHSPSRVVQHSSLVAQLSSVCVWTRFLYVHVLWARTCVSAFVCVWM